MTQIAELNGYMEKAHVISTSTAGFYREFRDRTAPEFSKIKENKDLTPEGKLNQAAALKAKRGTEFIQKAHARKQEYLANLEKARKGADTIVFAPLTKPDATKLERFEADFQSLKTELLLAADSRRALQKLDSFIRRIDDPYLAKIVRDQFSDISTNIISGDAELKPALSMMYQGLKDNFESDDVKSARDILEAATASMEKPSLFVPVVIANATEFIGGVHASYLNDTDSFFAKHPEHMPKEVAV